MTKELWYETLREKYISYLHWFTDEQIEDGIKELEDYFHEMNDNEILMRDSVIVHKLVKY